MPPKTAVLYNADTGLCFIKRSDDAGTRGYGAAGGFYCIMEEKGVRRADADPCRDSDEEIKRCQEEIEVITAQLSGRKDINKELIKIRSILNLAAESLNDDEVDRSFVDRFIRQIIVYPEENGMRLEIELNAGEKVSKSLIKPAGRTGQASKKMIESYEKGLK